MIALGFALFLAALASAPDAVRIAVAGIARAGASFCTDTRVRVREGFQPL